MKLFNVMGGSVLPKPLFCLKVILFPIEYFLSTNKILRYDFCRDTFHIDGIEISRWFVRELKEGEVYKVMKTEDGTLNIEKMGDI